jgi:hypothetical protein
MRKKIKIAPEKLKAKTDFVMRATAVLMGKKELETETSGTSTSIACFDFGDGLENSHFVDIPEGSIVDYTFNVEGGIVDLEVVSDGSVINGPHKDIEPGDPLSDSFEVPVSKEVFFKIIRHSEGDDITYLLQYSY